MKQSVSEIIKSIRKKEMIIFCGAGISRHSGLPLAKKLCQALLAKLNIETNDAETILNSDLPFEEFIELISTATDISSVLGIFQKGEPNANHIFIARLAKYGFLKIIITTNFDMLIEKALEREGLERDKHYLVYYSEKQFLTGDLQKTWWDRRIKVFKLHGSVEDMESIRTTIKAITNRRLSSIRATLIRNIFLNLNARYKQVLILGYSCSDLFDISSHIEDIRGEEEDFFYIGELDITLLRNSLRDNKEASRIILEYYGFSIGQAVNIEEAFTTAVNQVISMRNFHKVVEVDTYTTSLSGEAQLLLEKAQRAETNLREVETLKLNRALLAAIYPGLIKKRRRESKKLIILIEHDENKIGVENIRKETKKNPFRRFVGTRIRCKTEDFIKLCWDSFRRKCIGRYNFVENKVDWQTCIDQWLEKGKEYLKYYLPAVIFYNISFFKKAVIYFEKTLTDAIKTGNKAVESECYRKLGYIHCDLEDPDKAIEYGNKALEIALTEDKAECYHVLGIAYYRKSGQCGKVIECCNMALDIAVAAGNEVLAAKCYLLLSWAYRDAFYDDLPDIPKAHMFRDKAFNIASEIGDQSLLLECEIFSGTFSDSRNTLDFMDHWKYCLEFSKKLGNKNREGTCYRTLGTVYNRMGDFDNAIDCFVNAEKIIKKTGQTYLLNSIYEHLIRAHEEIGNAQKADCYRRKRDECRD